MRYVSNLEVEQEPTSWFADAASGFQSSDDGKAPKTIENRSVCQSDRFGNFSYLWHLLSSRGSNLKSGWRNRYEVASDAQQQAQRTQKTCASDEW